MSNSLLPAELLDNIVGLLHEATHSLRNCCLISKSWVPPTRKHLFANIRFHAEKDLRLWEKTFPDPSTSPACYAKTLFVGCPHLVKTADVEPGGWITGFSRLVNLELTNQRMLTHERGDCFIPFHGLSPVIRSLRVDYVLFSSSEIFDLILSFPLLEDLVVIANTEMTIWGKSNRSNELSTTVQPPSPPAFTGSLELSFEGGMKPIARRLLSSPGGLHFRKLTLTWHHEEDPSWTMALVEECSHTLESLTIVYILYSTLIRVCTCVPTDNLILSPAELAQTSIDLSKAKKLKDVVFRPKSRSVNWIATTLRTITRKHRDLRQISIHVPHYLTLSNVGDNIRAIIGDAACGQWLDLDRLLVQFWESRSIRPRMIRTPPRGERQDTWVRDCIGRLLPETTRREIIDLVEC